jgi:hypothetical protein
VEVASSSYRIITLSLNAPGENQLTRVLSLFPPRRPNDGQWKYSGPKVGFGDSKPVSGPCSWFLVRRAVISRNQNQRQLLSVCVKRLMKDCGLVTRAGTESRAAGVSSRLMRILYGVVVLHPIVCWNYVSVAALAVPPPSRQMRRGPSRLAFQI